VSGYSISSLEELGHGYGFRKVRAALGVTAFGVNGIVMPPAHEGFLHYHDTQDELYFVHRGRAHVEVGGEVREVGEGALVHVESTTPRRISNASADEDLVLLAIGGKDGYVARDGHLVDLDRDLARRQSFGSGSRT
jgi:mannose-6-phosphate isomerase-like protein (cupin superfamily)